jgi:hypothetical protein
VTFENETDGGSLLEQVFPFQYNLTTAPTNLYDSTDIDEINWHNIIYVKRHPVVKNMQLTFAVFGLAESIFYFYLSYSVSFKNFRKNFPNKSEKNLT